MTFIEKDGQTWIIANELAETIEYRNPRDAARKIITRNYTDFRGYETIEKIFYQGKMREVRLLNKDGVIMFCMLAKTPKATEIRRKIIEKLNQIEQMRNKMIELFAQQNQLAEKNRQEIKFLSTTVYDFNSKLQTLARAVKYLQEEHDNEPINSQKAEIISMLLRQLAKLKAVRERKEKTEQRHYKWAYGRFKTVFNIKRYYLLKNKDYKKAIGWINHNHIYILETN